MQLCILTVLVTERSLVKRGTLLSLGKMTYSTIITDSLCYYFSVIHRWSNLNFFVYIIPTFVN